MLCNTTNELFIDMFKLNKLKQNNIQACALPDAVDFIAGIDVEHQQQGHTDMLMKS